MGRNIVIVEDDVAVAAGLARALTYRSISVCRVGTLGTLQEYLHCNATPDLLVLDVVLPDGDGLDWLRRHRRKVHTRVLVVSGSEREAEAIRCGAHDYVGKPYDIQVLRARAEAQLRAAFRTAPLIVDPHQQVVRLREVRVHLSPRETRFLLTLAQQCGHLVPRKTLVAALGDKRSPKDNAITQVAWRLKPKLMAVQGGYIVGEKNSYAWVTPRRVRVVAPAESV